MLWVMEVTWICVRSMRRRVSVSGEIYHYQANKFIYNTLLCWIATVLEGLFGEYYSCTWLAGNSWNADDVKPSSLKIQREIRALMNKIHKKDLAGLLPARSLHLSAANVHRSGLKELSGATKSATEAAFNIISVSGAASQSRTSGCLGDLWTLLAQCCWWGVVFSEKAFQHSGNPTQQWKLRYRGESPFFN